MYAYFLFLFFSAFNFTNSSANDYKQSFLGKTQEAVCYLNKNTKAIENQTNKANQKASKLILRVQNAFNSLEVSTDLYDNLFTYIGAEIQSTKSDKLEILDDIIKWCGLRPTTLHRDLFLIEILNQVAAFMEKNQNINAYDYSTLKDKTLSSLRKLAVHITPVDIHQKKEKERTFKKRMLVGLLMLASICITIPLAFKLYSLSKKQTQTIQEQSQKNIETTRAIEQLSSLTDQQRQQLQENEEAIKRLEGLTEIQKADFLRQFSEINSRIETQQSAIRSEIQILQQGTQTAVAERNTILEHQEEIYKLLEQNRQVTLKFAEMLQESVDKILKRPPGSASNFLGILRNLTGGLRSVENVVTAVKTVDRVATMAGLGTQNPGSSTRSADSDLLQRLEDLHKNPPSGASSAFPEVPRQALN